MSSGADEGAGNSNLPEKLTAALVPDPTLVAELLLAFNTLVRDDVEVWPDYVRFDRLRKRRYISVALEWADGENTLRMTNEDPGRTKVIPLARLFKIDTPGPAGELLMTTHHAYVWYPAVMRISKGGFVAGSRRIKNVNDAGCDLVVGATAIDRASRCVCNCCNGDVCVEWCDCECCA